jgi:succinate dehydrogenase/fumarate reductase flavoprotein subunit
LKTIANTDTQDKYDVIVVGSGAGGLSTAAVAAFYGLSVLMIEKTSKIGGTSAWSGGWMWVPMNRHAIRAGIEDSREQINQYLDAVSNRRARGIDVDAFLDEAPRMVEFYEDSLGFKFIDGNRVPDFQNVTGAVDGGRSLCSAPVDNRKLGRFAAFLRRPLEPMTLAGMAIGTFELKHFFEAKTSLRSFAYVLNRLFRYGFGRLIWGRDVRSVNGNGLVAQLFDGCLRHGVDFVVERPVSDFHHRDDLWHVTLNDTETVSAKSLVLAGGGFPHSPELRKRLFDTSAGENHFSAALGANEGDLSKIAERYDGRLADDFIHAGAWSPVSLWKTKNGVVHFPHLVDRAKPGMVAVGPDGKRFVNEADSYHAFMSGLFASYKQDNPFCWLITDQIGFSRWGIGAVKPLPGQVTKAVRDGYLHVAKSVNELAESLALPGDVLANTLSEFSDKARQGVDPDFGRGDSLYNRVQGDPSHGPNPSLGTVSKTPFYAVKIVSGSLGTFSGIRTNEFGQILDSKNNTISNIYAVGNEAASIFKGSYPSGGITLGPAMTFGYIIAKHIKNQSI